MSRRVVVILIVLALVAAVVALIVWLTSRSNATGQAVEAAVAQEGADPVEFRAGRDIARAERTRANLLRELQILATTPEGAGSLRFQQLHAMIAAIERLYPSLRNRP